jgi:hypothetical protein
MMHIVAVGMRDVATFGSDLFFVQVSPTHVMPYLVSRETGAVPTAEAPLPLSYVSSAIETANAAFRLDVPIAIESDAELVSYLGRFRPIDDTWCHSLPREKDAG